MFLHWKLFLKANRRSHKGLEIGGHLSHVLSKSVMQHKIFVALCCLSMKSLRQMLGIWWDNHGFVFFYWKKNLSIINLNHISKNAFKAISKTQLLASIIHCHPLIPRLSALLCGSINDITQAQSYIIQSAAHSRPRPPPSSSVVRKKEGGFND